MRLGPRRGVVLLALPDAREPLVLAGLLGRPLVRGGLGLGDEVRIEIDDLVAALQEVLEGRRVLVADFHPEVERHALARTAKQRLVAVGELVPDGLVDLALVERGRLMDAGHDDVFGDLLIAGRLVHPRRAPLDAVHHLALERRIDLGAGQDDRGRAERLRDLGPGAGGAHLHALVVGQRGHALVAVHEHLGRRGTAGNGGDVEFVHAPLHEQAGAAAAEHPVDHLLVFHGPGEAAEQHAGPVDAPVVAGPVVADLRDALAHGVGHFERLAERAAREHLDLDLAVCEELDLLGNALGGVLEQRPAAPRRGHAPLLCCARRRSGRAEAGEQRCGRGDCRFGSHAGFPSVSLPCARVARQVHEGGGRQFPASPRQLGPDRCVLSNRGGNAPEIFP